MLMCCTLPMMAQRAASTDSVVPAMVKFTGALNDAQKEVAAAAAQKAVAAALVGNDSTSTCSFTYTSGVNDTFLKYCVTVNGNITQLETPVGHEHIAVGVFGEGYGVCDATANVAYYDYADFGDSGNWGAPVTTQPNATTVKVVRNTSDGIWTLTQTITQVAASSSIQIAMALTNNTAVDRRASLIRYADVDANSSFLNNFDSTTNSSWGNNSLFSFGLMLQNVGNPPSSFGLVGISQNVPSGPDPCNFYAHSVEPLKATDGSIALLYDIFVAAQTTQTDTMIYKGL